jgi:hypothetical protein
MEVPPVDPLQGRIQQEGSRRSERDPRVGQPVTAEQPDRDGACRDRRGLDQVEELGAGTKLMERD